MYVMRINLDSFVFPHGEYPPKGILASYTDRDGYVVRIDALPKPSGDADPYFGRYGVAYITDPDGATIKGGFWMNRPEEDWNFTPMEWVALSWEERAAREVEQQAIAYKPLKEQFHWHLVEDIKTGLRLVLDSTVICGNDDRILTALFEALGQRGFTLEQIGDVLLTELQLRDPPV
jgi:hypothetical protein